MIGKPGQSSTPVGKQLNCHANECAKVVLGLGKISPATHRTAIHAKAIVEAFPSSFLGLMIAGPQLLDAQRGNRSDIFYVHLARTGVLTRLISDLLPNRRLVDIFEAVTNHDDRAAVVLRLRLFVHDKGLEGASHHAVIPNVNTIDKLREVWPRLSSDEKKLFDVIARTYLAALMPDFRYRQTTATLDVRGFEFRASGRQPIALGWRAAFPDWQPADEKGDEAHLLRPPLRNGETAQLHDPKIEDKETRPPPRYNEGTLIEAMQSAWRFVDDEVLRERLKEAKGIGTPATRAGSTQSAG